jgi:type IV pilus assembly protein PilQ
MRGRLDPEHPGLGELRDRILEAMLEQRALELERRLPLHQQAMSVEIREQQLLPATYGRRRTVPRIEDDPAPAPTAAEEMLAKRISLHLEDVGLTDFVLEVGRAEGINIVADNGLDSDRTMTIHADDVPLREVLDYASRNMDVSFYLGDAMIWVTRRETSESAVPMETRMFRLRKGVTIETADGSGGGVSIVQAINLFVPPADGSDLMFDANTHILLAKNTRANIRAIEELMRAMDVVPPQVLIEARFISTSINDLRELGLDWTLNSPIVVGGTESQPRTQIAPGAAIGYAGFPPENQVQGLNLTYQGLLTDPMFEAVLHALELSGKSRTLSVPKVTTVNNREAVVKVLKTFPYFERGERISEIIGYNRDGNPIFQYSWQWTDLRTLIYGYELTVTPSVGSDLAAIRLKIKPKIEDLLGWTEYPTGDEDLGMIRLPLTQERSIESEVVVQSGETVVMGGLITSSDGDTEKKVPFLASIPLLGRLFRHDARDEIRENLIIFVTARILSDSGEELVQLPPPAPVPGAAGEAGAR